MHNATSQRLYELLSLLHHHTDEGLSVQYAADQLGVSRQTIYNDIDRLTLDGYLIHDEHHRFFIDPGYDRDLRLTLAQAWFMYLPLRRIVRAELHRYPLVMDLLRRITNLFQSEIADQLFTPTNLEVDHRHDELFTTLVLSWHRQQHVNLHYRRPNATRETQFTFAPWWFEPAVWSDAFYVIGGMLQKGGGHDPLTLKLDRIQAVESMQSKFERPSGKEIVAQIREAWGIWTSESEPVPVKLRFHNRQLDRLRETRWHPTQQMMIEPGGSIIWSALIAEPQEMLPWIRGWGADVEVLEPEHLRQQVASEAAAMAQMYGQPMPRDARRYF